MSLTYGKGSYVCSVLGGDTFPREVVPFLSVAHLYKSETCNHKQLKATSPYLVRSITS